MTLKIGANVNGSAKRNVGEAYNEYRRLKSTLGGLGNAGDFRVEITKEQHHARRLVAEYLDDDIDIFIASGGDGTMKTWLTEMFKELYRRFGRGMTPIRFARQMNRMALDPKSGLHLPMIYHRKRGGVNVYAETLGMEGKLETIAENVHEANRRHESWGTRAFARAYVPVMMLYSKERPDDLEMLQIMGMFADASIYNFFEGYYEPRRRGGNSSMMTAASMIARIAASIGASRAIDAMSNGITGERDVGKKIYTDRYVDEILQEIEGTVTIDGKVAHTTRSVTAAGTMGVSLYGLKPFWNRPARAEDFQPYYYPTFGEKDDIRLTPEAIAEQKFQYLGGTPDPLDIMRILPALLKGRQTHLKGITDTLASRLEIDQPRQDDEKKNKIKIIVDGSEEVCPLSVAIEIAYLQPFILLDYAPLQF